MRRAIFFSIFILLNACSIEPEKFEFGHDNCSYCSMTIVDQKHASQIVTTKGKVHKYDSIECLVRDSKKLDESSIALKIVTDFESGTDLINAESAFFLISPEIPSPMGANLSAFSDKAKAEHTQREKTGELFGWNTLLQKIK